MGPATAKNLRTRQIETLEDALFFLPVRYQDRRRIVPISQLQPGQEAVVAGRVARRKESPIPGRRLMRMSVADNSGRIEATWFHFKPVVFSRYQPNEEILLFGRVEEYKGRPVFVHPEIIPPEEAADQTGRFVPVYRDIPGVSPKKFRRVIKSIVETELGRLDSPLPDWLIQAEGLADLDEAFSRVHFPQSEEDASLDGRPRQSLTLTELFVFQAGLRLSRQRRLERRAEPMAAFDRARQEATARLPFSLTTAQERVLDELGRDLARPHPMSRLLQGDVGSGKTVLATVAMLAAALSGRQAALMAPTEILAEQHFGNLTPLAEALGLKVALLTGSLAPADHQARLDDLAAGKTQLAIGTHALIQDRVAFDRLGLVVIDEQHRFGVLQRAALGQKGDNPHLLYLTATPIPRSLSLAFYGDLDISVLDQKPPGLKPVVTRLLPPRRIERAWQAVERAVAQGWQAYVVLPAIEPKEGSGLELATAQERFDHLQQALPHLRVGLLHGRMDKERQVETMRLFASGRVDVLVATTVVEVGLDVAGAAVMVIENAERFGLAQIHQLRGRVGRGGSEAACLLISDAEGDSLDRLRILEETDDGFRIAEADLKARGPGEVLGTQQAGWPDFRLANLMTDSRELVRAREAAEELIRRDPDLIQPEHQPLAEILSRRRIRSLLPAG